MAKPIQMVKRANELWYEPETNISDAESIAQTLPENHRKSALLLIKKLGKRLKLNENGYIIYDNKPSDNSFRDTILWYFDPKKYFKPYDGDKFVKLVNVPNFPKNWTYMYK
jgi:hypothetical protein